MRSRLVQWALLAMALLGVGALPAMANHVDAATVNADCDGLVITVSGGDLEYPDAIVTYSVTFDPPVGPIRGSVHVTRNADGSFSATEIHPWSEFGIAARDLFCMSGSATLLTNNGQTVENTLSIFFYPQCLYCASTCTGTIGDFVWSDSNCNGTQDFAEPGLNGITVKLKNSAGAVVATTTTMQGPSLQNGYYQFRNLCAGTYSVEVDTTTLPTGSTPSACTTGSNSGTDSNCSPAAVVLTGSNGSDQTIDFGYCPPVVGKTFSIGPSSMEGHLTIMPGDWMSGGYSFKFKDGGHAATQFTVKASVAVTVTCPKGGGPGGTAVVDLGTKTYSVPARNTDWLPTGDQNSVLSWMGAAKVPNLCNGNPMDNARGAVYTATVSQNPKTGSLVDFRFKYRDPNAKGKGNVNCLDTTDPRRAKADVCGASWSATITDP